MTGGSFSRHRQEMEEMKRPLTSLEIFIWCLMPLGMLAKMAIAYFGGLL